MGLMTWTSKKIFYPWKNWSPQLLYSSISNSTLVGLLSYLLMPVVKVWELSSYRIITLLRTCPLVLTKVCRNWERNTCRGIWVHQVSRIHFWHAYIPLKSTDHKPLEAIFKKPLHLAPVRLQKMIMSLPYCISSHLEMFSKNYKGSNLLRWPILLTVTHMHHTQWTIPLKLTWAL